MHGLLVQGHRSAEDRWIRTHDPKYVPNLARPADRPVILPSEFAGRRLGRNRLYVSHNSRYASTRVFRDLLRASPGNPRRQSTVYLGEAYYHGIDRMSCLCKGSCIGACVLALLLAGLLGCGTVGSAYSEPPEISAAKALIGQQRFAEAQGILQDLVRRPAAPPAEAFYQLAVCHARQDRHEVANRNLDMALEKEPMHLPALHLKAYLQFAAGQFQESIRWSGKFLEAQPSGGETRKISGLARFMLGDKDGAELDLKQATAVLPRDFEAHYYLGRVYFERSKLTPALESFRRAIVLSPRSVKAHNHLGQTLEGLARFDAAVSVYEKAIEFESEGSERSEWPYYNLGSLLLSEGYPQRAVELLEQALERNRSSVQTRTKLGVALSAASRLDDAARQLRTAVQADPENADAHYQLGRVLMKLGRSDEARGHLSQFERLREP